MHSCPKTLYAKVKHGGPESFYIISSYCTKCKEYQYEFEGFSDDSHFRSKHSISEASFFMYLKDTQFYYKTKNEWKKMLRGEV